MHLNKVECLLRKVIDFKTYEHTNIIVILFNLFWFLLLILGKCVIDLGMSNDYV